MKCTLTMLTFVVAGLTSNASMLSAQAQGGTFTCKGRTFTVTTQNGVKHYRGLGCRREFPPAGSPRWQQCVKERACGH